MYITCAACVWMCLNNSSTKEISHQSFCCSRKAWNKTPQWLQNCSHQPTDYCRFIKGFYFKNHRPEVPSPCNSSRLWRWCASHRPGIPISEHFGLFFFYPPPPHRKPCVFFLFLSASGCTWGGGSGLHWRRRGESERFHRSVSWQTEMTHIQQEPCLFCMAKWGRGWRVATETLGSGQTSPHFSTLFDARDLHCIASAASLIRPNFLHSAWWKMQLVWGHPPPPPPPPPDTHCCHDRQRSPLDRGSAGWRRGGLIRDAGSRLRMLFCPWSPWISSAHNTPWFLLREKKK